MYELLDLPIKLFNPLLDMWFFLNQFMSGKMTLALIAVISLVALFFIYKLHKVVFVLFLLIVLYGFWGIGSALYFIENFKELEINTPSNLEEQAIGNWCKENDKIALLNDHSIKMNINGDQLNGTWEYSRAHIKIENSSSHYKEIRIIGFGDELFLNLSNPSPGVRNYSDLEYARCN